MFNYPASGLICAISGKLFIFMIALLFILLKNNKSYSKAKVPNLLIKDTDTYEKRSTHYNRN